MKTTMAAIFLLILAFAAVSVHSQDQSGFITIDCGSPKGGNYTDKTTSLYYVSDEGFIETGTNVDISPIYLSGGLLKPLETVRSFPTGTKNCYTLRPDQGKATNYMIRATFMYGNYDSKNKLPEFELHLGTDVWDTVKIGNLTQIVTKEMIYTPAAEYMYVCLVNVGLGTPFISTLELRHLGEAIYSRVPGSFELVFRYYAYTTSLAMIRYNDDVFDRTWLPANLQNGTTISTTSSVDNSRDPYLMPSSAMESGFVPINDDDPLVIVFPTESLTSQYYVYLHFAELQRLSANETREFNITVNGGHFYGPYSPSYLSAFTVRSSGPLSGSTLSFRLDRTANSTLPPIINAMEYYKVRLLPQALTQQLDVNAMLKVKASYGLSKNWEGDPCVPQSYTWDGVNCSFSNAHSPDIISLNLSSNGLSGSIAPSFSNLTSLEILDLSNNSLTGQIPESLAGLSSLRILNLVGNKLNGSVPQSLAQKANNGQLSISLDPSLDQCLSSSCNATKKNIIVPIAASIGAFLGLVVIAALVVLFLNKRKKPDTAAEATEAIREETNLPPQPAYDVNRGGLARFTYSEVTDMTKGFDKQLGKGGFGIVYYGCLKDGTEVAVKKLYAAHALEQFETEVELLMAIRHKNLVSLVGYCDEGENLVLIYEYMGNGDLQCVLSEKATPTWKQRLQIAIDAAQGLDYLHNGCRPPIVHRDIKTPNILLNENLQAKVADFGLSKIFPDENKSYMSTRVIGTPGYLDPTYYITQQLNEKSDIYSFGVVLLELMTGERAVIRSATDNTNLVDKVRPLLETGDIWSIVDPRVKGTIHNRNSVWRIIDVAMACVRASSIERPGMSHIVTELKECLAMEMGGGAQGYYSSSAINFDSTEMSPAVRTTSMAPRAR